MRSLRTLAFAGLAIGSFVSPASTQTVKVGVILTYSGADLNNGLQIDRGLRLYMKEHEKELPPGVKLEVVVKDDGGPNPDAAKRLAQELIVRDKVNLIAGLVWTPNAAAIAPMVTEAKVPLVLMNAASSGLSPCTSARKIALRLLSRSSLAYSQRTRSGLSSLMA